MNYKDFLETLDKKLAKYFKRDKEYLCCKSGCSECCEKGDYPISELELKYLMHGFISLDNQTKIRIQNNIKHIQKGGTCPFLLDQKCSIYPYRPIICRVHGLAYLCTDNTVKVPYCVNNSKNYTKAYDNGEIIINPIKENLDTQSILKDFEYGEIRNLIEWLNL